jgi:hypothetical protein
VDRLVEHFRELHEHVHYLQANFLFGLDGDEGDEPVALTKEFMTRTPFVWPVVNIPHPFGGTPLFDAQLAAGSILTTLPFSFYYSRTGDGAPALRTVEYYDRMIDLFARVRRMLARRIATPSRTSGWSTSCAPAPKRRRRRPSGPASVCGPTVVPRLPRREVGGPAGVLPPQYERALRAPCVACRSDRMHRRTSGPFRRFPGARLGRVLEARLIEGPISTRAAPTHGQ